MFFVIKKRSIIVIASLILVLIVAFTTFGVFVGSVETATNRLVPIYSVATDKADVALTFDAAWGADKTKGIMDELEKNGFKGTFFLTGFWVDDYPDLVKEIMDRGHLVASHSENHKHLSDLDKEGLIYEIDSVSKKIKGITGEEPKFFRAPFGEYDNQLIGELDKRNIKCIQWSIDSLDWKGISAKEITERVVNKIKKGDIVLFHNNSDNILEALPLILMSLKNKGLNAVRIDELAFENDYYIDGNGVQIKK